MCRRIVICLPLTFFLLTVSLAQAQQPTKVPRIGYLDGAFPSTNAARIDAFRQGLRELGYVEGKSIVIDWRSADGKLDRLPALASELVRLKVDIIVTGGASPTRAAKAATSTIPIVMAPVGDPVGSGFVASLARPGGNITGLSTFAPELGGKRLELLKEVIPKLSRVAVFGNSTAPGYAPMIREMEVAANAFKVQLQYQNILDSKDIETAFHAASKGRADAVVTFESAILSNQRAQIVELATKNRLPAIYHNSPYVKPEGL